MGYAEQLYPDIEWAQTRSGIALPPGFQPLAAESLETYLQTQANGYAAPHDDILQTPMPYIPEDNLTSRDVHHTVDGLRAAIDLEQERTGGRVNGLSANQIKISASIAGLALNRKANTSRDLDMTFLANPTIKPLAVTNKDGRNEYKSKTVPHGCVSSSLDLWSTIEDFNDVLLTGWDVTNPRKPKWLEMELHDYPAVIAQHEVRHLQGMTSAKWALIRNGMRQNPQDPDQLINWRPDALLDKFRSSFAADQATASWQLKASVRMVDAIDKGSYLAHYVEL
ncbi:MAG TPA: peptide deformylase [Candidatus Saccharimonadales bacterium]|nr:peptide deformylase [Candidatus Saccharimonadales bacterium]